jgi:hypothetical protein
MYYHVALKDRIKVEECRRTRDWPYHQGRHKKGTPLQIHGIEPMNALYSWRPQVVGTLPNEGEASPQDLRIYLPVDRGSRQLLLEKMMGYNGRRPLHYRIAELGLHLNER